METAAFGVGCFIKRKSGIFLLDALDGQSLGGLHQQHAHAVEENGTHDEGNEENWGRWVARAVVSMQATVR